MRVENAGVMVSSDGREQLEKGELHASSWDSTIRPQRLGDSHSHWSRWRRIWCGTRTNTPRSKCQVD